MDVDALKKRFSLALFTVPGNPFKAACVVFPNDVSLACQMAVEWNTDHEVLAEIERLTSAQKELEIEELDNVPTKKDTLELAWDIANNPLELGKDRVAALKLYAEINNLMPDKTINKNIKIGEIGPNRVMLVPVYGDDANWSSKLLKQQTELTNVG